MCHTLSHLQPHLIGLLSMRLRSLLPFHYGRYIHVSYWSSCPKWLAQRHAYSRCSIKNAEWVWDLRLGEFSIWSKITQRVRQGERIWIQNCLTSVPLLFPFHSAKKCFLTSQGHSLIPWSSTARHGCRRRPQPMSLIWSQLQFHLRGRQFSSFYFA